MKQIFLLAQAVIILAVPGFSQKFYRDDPLWVDRDSVVGVDQIKEHKLIDYYDFLENTFMGPGGQVGQPAQNINTLGEVPDSSWFENRHGRKRMAINQLVLGPNQEDLLVGSYKPWVVIAAKTEGITPGFTVRNRRGEVYFVKFDPPRNPEMTTAAEVICTKFFHAMGYHVPENYLVFLRPKELRIGSKARVTITGGAKRGMTRKDLDDIFRRVHRQPDGNYRVIASRRLEGTPLGPFKYYGTRPDDPNDVFPHENRRELRGLWVLSSWLNHDDSRAINSLDMLIEPGSRRYVKHYLIDFGSTLGSGSVGPQKPRAGFEYMWEAKPAFARILTLGLWDRSWITAKYPDYPAIGRFESKRFEPQEWKPEYPNPAFIRCNLSDAYWGAKIVMRFSDEEVRAIVKTGQISDSSAENYLHETLLVRRNKIGRYWLNRVNSFDNFKLAGGELSFDHLASYYGFADVPTSFRVEWFVFDNLSQQSTPLAGPTDHSSLKLSLPDKVRQGSEGDHFLAALRLPDENEMELKTVNLYFRHFKNRLEIVGIERDP